MTRPPPRDRAAAAEPRVSIARALSKLGACSRTEGERAVAEGRVRVDGAVVRDVGRRVDPDRDRIELDGRPVQAARRVYLILNKPRGLVTSRTPERGAGTVYDCLADASLPFISAVGRLDKASEGLLLFTNDTRWADRLLAPGSHVDKSYHVQIDRVPDDALLAALRAGVDDAGERLAVKDVRTLRHGTRTAWLEIILDEGRNRHIRRLLAALGVEVQRLVRVAFGPLVLGDLPKGAVRALTDAERRALAGAADAAARRR